MLANLKDWSMDEICVFESINTETQLPDLLENRLSYFNPAYRYCLLIILLSIWYYNYHNIYEKKVWKKKPIVLSVKFIYN